MLVVLPFLSYALVAHLLWMRGAARDPRHALVAAALVWGVLTAAFTELLSVFQLLNGPALAVCWSGAVLVPAGLSVRAGRGIWKHGLRASRPPWLELSMLVAVGVIALATLGLGLVSWPNTYDAITYHLSRVAHWMQNGSVTFYPTNIPRQLFNPPWAEYAIAHLVMLGGDDRLAHLVQWFSMVGSVVTVSAIAMRLGANRRGQVFSALFCATLPMGILEAVSTQNDYATAFWLACAAYALLSWRAENATMGDLMIGASAGLTVLTKGTGYLFIAPFVLVFVATRWRQSWIVWLRSIALITVVAVLLNGGHFVRNVGLYGSILGPPDGAPTALNDATGLDNEEFSLRVLASNTLRNAALHIGTPSSRLNAQIEADIATVHTWLGLDVSDHRTTWANTTFHIPLATQRLEDFSGNPFHLLLVIAGMVAFAVSARSRQNPRIVAYILAVTFGFALFSLVVKWQPWHSRLQLPAFVLWSPLAGLLLQDRARVLGLASLVLTLWAAPFLLADEKHPLVGRDSVFTMSRATQYFRERPFLESGYVGAADYIRSTGCRSVGLDLGWSGFEYPLWWLLADPSLGPGRLEHVNVTNNSAALRRTQPAFTPCAVLAEPEALTDPTAETLVVDGRVFGLAWSSPVVRVFMAGASTATQPEGNGLL